MSMYCLDAGYPWGVYLWPGGYLMEQDLRRPGATCKPRLFHAYKEACEFERKIRHDEQRILSVRTWADPA